MNFSARPVEALCRCGIAYSLPGNPDAAPIMEAVSPYVDARMRVCQHRGKYKGQASCGCGGIYQCELLFQANGEPMLCGNRSPIDEFVDFQGTPLTLDTYRRMSDCPSNPSNITDQQLELHE